MEQITVNLGARSYPIFFFRGGINSVSAFIQKAGFTGKISIISNPKINRLYGRKVVLSLKKIGFAPNVIEIPDGEEHKNLKTVSYIYDNLISNKMERTSPVIALGGGVIGDLAGFVSATYLRGVPYVQIPTTLLSQVDSSIGGKTGVNHSMGKNLIGAFYQPNFVFIDSAVLKTLQEREIKAGLAEVIKYGVISDKKLFAFLEKNSKDILKLGGGIDYAVKRSCEIKADIVEKDETEKGLRAILNYGHTFGHAIESLTHYKEFRHGEAVAIGMVMAAGLSHKLGLCSANVYKRIQALVKAFELPISMPHKIGADKFAAVMELDKKVIGSNLRFVLVRDIGDVILREVKKDALLPWLTEELGRL